MNIIEQNELIKLTETLEELIRYDLIERITVNNLSEDKKKLLSEGIRALYKVTDILKGKVVLPFNNNATIDSENITESQNNKDYTKYSIAFSNGKVLTKVSKRALLTEVIKYLIGEEGLGQHAFDRLFNSSLRENSCNRVFAKNKGDILYGDELSENDSDYKRYTKIDFSEYPNASNNGIIYVANNWEKESIQKLIKYLNDEFKDFLKITEYQK